MEINSALKKEEAASFRLRALYKNYGYRPYKMSKFEEYDLYVKNKDFLLSDRIITFNDTNGKLVALKPDVTLSIIKNTGFQKGTTEKYYYNENVYRVSKNTGMFKEIMQAGIECVGDIDLFSESEVVLLAAKSLRILGENCLLDLSHTGVVSAVLAQSGLTDAEKSKLIELTGEKNTHGIIELCGKTKTAKILCGLCDLYGKAKDVLPKVKELCGEMASDAVAELEDVCNVLTAQGQEDILRLDFSVVNNMHYYQGLVFSGYIDDIPTGILSGGRYDPLMQKMGKKSGAIGFACYLDLLELADHENRTYDCDVLVLYDENVKTETVFETVSAQKSKGSVLASRTIPAKLKYKEVVDLTNGGTK